MPAVETLGRADHCRFVFRASVGIPARAMARVSGSQGCSPRRRVAQYRLSVPRGTRPGESVVLPARAAVTSASLAFVPTRDRDSETDSPVARATDFSRSTLRHQDLRYVLSRWRLLRRRQGSRATEARCGGPAVRRSVVAPNVTSIMSVTRRVRCPVAPSSPRLNSRGSLRRRRHCPERDIGRAFSKGRGPSRLVDRGVRFSRDRPYREPRRRPDTPARALRELAGDTPSGRVLAQRSVCSSAPRDVAEPVPMVRPWS